MPSDADLRAAARHRRRVRPGEPEDAFTEALVAALADPEFIPNGGKLGMPCLHLYTLPTDEKALSGVKHLRDQLKGRDRLVADALERAGLAPRVVPYVYETCGGDSWRLHREANARERQMFTQNRLKGSILEKKLPIEFHAYYGQADDVTWLGRPPWIGDDREPQNGRPEPEVELLGETEYSTTDYFGNEASYVAFYAAAALLIDISPNSARRHAEIG